MKLFEIIIPKRVRQLMIDMTRIVDWSFKPHDLADASVKSGWKSYVAKGYDDDHIQINFHDSNGDIVVHAVLDMDIGDNHDVYDKLVNILGPSRTGIERGRNHIVWDAS